LKISSGSAATSSYTKTEEGKSKRFGVFLGVRLVSRIAAGHELFTVERLKVKYNLKDVLGRVKCEQHGEEFSNWWNVDEQTA
jgi:hypothetical protein